MTSSENHKLIFDDLPEPDFHTALKLFAVEKLQSLDPDSVSRCQAILGHGKEYGVWETSEKVIGYRLIPAFSKLIIRDSIIRKLPVDVQVTPKLLELLKEGELWLSRYALLLRLGQSSLRRNQRSLDPSTIIRILYKSMPSILVAGILERLCDKSGVGLVCCIKQEAFNMLSRNDENAQELNRLAKFYDMGLWSDAPRRERNEKITNPAGSKIEPVDEAVSSPYQPLSDRYMATMGPRVLWVVKVLGPELLKLGEQVEAYLKADGCLATRDRDVVAYLKRRKWINSDGSNSWKPPFSSDDYSYEKEGLKQRYLRFGDFRALRWSDIICLFSLLQSAHLWIVLLATGGRVGEVTNLPRQCVEMARDGKSYINGKTFKLSDDIFGEEREWPAPDVLIDTMAQQAELVNIYEGLLTARIDGRSRYSCGSGLWISIGFGRLVDSNKRILSVNYALNTLAERLGVNREPADQNVHSHRFRKTIARLVALTIVEGPRVLMRLLGHKNISMTLSYMLADKGLQAEIDTVARELRILRCKDVVANVHAGLHRSNDHLDHGYGGGAMPAIEEAVKKFEARLDISGYSWDDRSAQELATILTFNGQNYRLIKPGVICTNSSRDLIPCVCNSDCVNRIEDKTARRDVEVIIPLLIANAKRAIADQQLLVAENFFKQLEDEMLRFHDIGNIWQTHPDIIYIRKCLED